MEATVGISDEFWKSVLNQDGTVTAKAMRMAAKLRKDPQSPGLDLKRPKGAIDQRVRTARVSQFWRAVLFAFPEISRYVLVAVLPHDDAYVYAAGLKFTVNEATGFAELFDEAAVADVLREDGQGGKEDQGVRGGTHVSDGGGVGGGSTDQAVGESSGPVLKGISLEDLRRFGIPSEVATAALAATDQARFDKLCDAVPMGQGMAMLDLAGGKPVDDVFADLVGQVPEEFDVEDVAAALERTVGRMTFVEDTPEDLIAAIEGDLAAWRVWLHPLQRKLAYHDGWNGPFRVTGGAGTGKTVTALHRARHLAERAMAAGIQQPAVLFVTFTKNLAEVLRGQLRELGGPTMDQAVDVIHLDGLAARVLKNQPGPQGRRVGADDKVVRNAWETAASGTDYSADFLLDEWVDVVLAQGIVDQAGYFKASRQGRGRALNRPKRADVWEAIESATASMAASQVMTFTQAAARAATIAASRPDLQFRHVVVDEAQDLHPAHWRLVRAMVPDGVDDIFLVGDGHQRIYGKPLVLSRFGIRTQGRSRRLTVNYRTSEEILRWTVAVMASVSVDDLEGEDDSLVGARSMFRGPKPELLGASGYGDEDQRIAEVVQAWIDDGVAPSEIGVLAHANFVVDHLVDVLKAAGVKAGMVTAGATPAQDAVQVMTMHRAKGLEFVGVVIARMGANDFPPKRVREMTGAEREQAMLRERALVYVAGSRARERLAVVFSGDSSELLG